jgi:hypothetical protein
MKKLFVVVMTLSAIAAMSSPATADFYSNTVSIGACVFGEDGQTTVPAGASVVVGETWLDTSAAAVRRFLRVQNTTATIDGAPVPNASTLWGPVEPFPPDPAYWSTTWSYDAGVLSNPGDAVTVTWDIVFQRRFRDGSGNAFPAGSSAFGGPLTCTIVAT